MLPSWNVGRCIHQPRNSPNPVLLGFLKPELLSTHGLNKAQTEELTWRFWEGPGTLPVNPEWLAEVRENTMKKVQRIFSLLTGCNSWDGLKSGDLFKAMLCLKFFNTGPVNYWRNFKKSEIHIYPLPLTLSNLVKLSVPWENGLSSMASSWWWWVNFKMIPVSASAVARWHNLSQIISGIPQKLHKYSFIASGVHFKHWTYKMRSSNKKKS